MKKLFLSLFVLLLAISLFAADLAAPVTVSPTIDKDGFRLENSSFDLKVSVGGDKSGADFSIGLNAATQQKKKGFRLDGGVWFKPNDDYKISAGAASQIAFDKDLKLIPADLYNYASVEINKDDINKCYFQVASLIPYDYNYKNNKYYYVAKVDFGKSNYFNAVVGHIDSRGKFSFVNGKPVVHMFKTSAMFSPNGNPYEYGGFYYNNYQGVLTDVFSGWYKGLGWLDDSDFLKTRYIGTYTTSKYKLYTHQSKIFRVALAYQYSENYDNRDNGLLLDVYFKDIPLGAKLTDTNYTSSLTVGAELSFKKFDVELGYHYNNGDRVNPFDIAGNTSLTLTYNKNGKVDFNVPYAIAEMKKVEVGTTLYSSLEYVHSKDDRSGNGVFFTFNPSGNIGSCAWEVNMHTGFDGKQLKDYKTAGSFSVAF